MHETIQQNDNTPERQGKVHLEKKIVFRVSTTKREIVVTIESVILGISRIANTSRKINVKCERIVRSHTERIVRSCTHKRRIDSPKEKAKGKESQKVGVTNDCNFQYCKSPPKDYFRKALVIRNFHEHLLEGRWKPRASGTIPAAHRRHSYAHNKTSVREEEYQILIIVWREPNSETNFYL